MLTKFSRNWWLFALRGLVAVAFGIVAIVRPEQSMQALVLVFGAFALVDGILTTSVGISTAPFFNRWWAVLLNGVVGIVVGLMAIFMPDITGRALVYVIAIWALLTGVLQIVVAVQFRHVLKDEWMLVLGGMLSILFGVLLFVFPAAGAVSLIWVIGFYAIAFGISEIVFAFRLQGFRRDLVKAVESGS